MRRNNWGRRSGEGKGYKNSQKKKKKRGWEVNKTETEMGGNCVGSDRRGNDSGERERRQEAELPLGLASLSFPPAHTDSLFSLIQDFTKVVLRPALHFNLQISLAVTRRGGGCCVLYVILCLCSSYQLECNSGPQLVCRQSLFTNMHVQSSLICSEYRFSIITAGCILRRNEMWNN